MGRGIVTAYNIPVECGEVIVAPGDFVFADFDGVVVVPKDRVKEVIELATDKVQRENHSRRCPSVRVVVAMSISAASQNIHSTRSLKS